MKLYIASDHAGFTAKEELKRGLPDFEWADLGPSSDERTDYPDEADRLCEALKDSSDFGVLICGTGQGMCMRANRHSHIRAAVVHSNEVAELTRAHNNANVICFGARLSEVGDLIQWVKTFVNTPFEGGRHQKRVDKLSKEAP